MLYELTWRLTPLEAGQPERRPGRWLVLADRAGLGTEITKRLAQKHQTPVLLHPEAARADGGLSGPADASLDHVLRLLDGDAGAGTPPFAGILDLRAMDGPCDGDPQGASPAEDPERRISGRVLSLMRALIDRKGRPGAPLSPRLWIVTRGAQALDAQEDPSGFAQAELWGLGRVFGVEHPELWGGLVDLDLSRPPAEASMLVDHLTSDKVAPEVALRKDARYVSSIGRFMGLGGASEPVALRTTATYLITGGLGALGLRWAQWMVRRGARHLVLVGRRPPGAEAREALATLRAQGTRVHVIQADVSSAADVDTIFRLLSERMPKLAGIVHAAGVKEDAVLSNIEWESFARVLASKVQGSTNLSRAAQHCTLDFFVFFSSVAGLLGNPGQASYAAANAFQDAFAQHLRARGVPALSIAWGPFEASGMARDFVGVLKKRWGLDGITFEDALALFERLLRWNGAHVIAMSIDPSRLAERPLGATEPVLLVEGKREAPRAEAEQPRKGNDLLQRLARSPPEKRVEILIEQVNAVARDVMGLDRTISLNRNQRLDELGLDSLLALDLVEGLTQALGVTLSLTLAQQYPTVSLIAHYLAQELDVCS
jgi:NAD(P)-dependent dehydrogenase (short-subunit alcohol dehydrogenase family)/acyl carrier protein